MTVKLSGEKAKENPVKVMLLTVGLGVGGVERRILEMACRFDRTRFEILVCSLKGEGIIADELRERGIRVIALEGTGKLDIRVLMRLYQMLRRERPAVVHAFLFRANLVSRLVGRWLQVPVLISSYEGIDVWKRWHHILADRLTSRWAHLATCCSEAVRQFAIANFGGRSDTYVTIHNGVDCDTFASRPRVPKAAMGLPLDRMVVGTVCRLDEPTKGLGVLLRAMEQVSRMTDLPKWQLVIVGDGSARAALERQCTALDLAECVTFLGERRDVPNLLPLFDLFVLPSLYEGFGIAIVEAMAAGRPVVATTVGGIPEIVIHEETGLLVPPGDATALAEAIKEILNNPMKAREMAIKGQIRAREKFSIHDMIRRHETLYETLLGHHIKAKRSRGSTLEKQDVPVVTH